MTAPRLLARAALSVAALALVTPAFAQTDATAGRKAGPAHTRAEDVIYGRRDGLALTMDVFTPANEPNGAGVIMCVSASYRSGRDLLEFFRFATAPFLERGYVVFAVMHSSQPKFTVVEAIEDTHRAVRFIRANAKKYGVDPNRLGACGGSAGGHLALMMGCAGRPANPAAEDPVDRESSKVAAVACFFPPTDFAALDGKCPKDTLPAFDFRELDPATGKYAPVSEQRRREIGSAASPITHVTKAAAPTLIVHGDRDTLVPVEQSKVMIAKLKGCGVECELVVKEGKHHYWLGIDKDVPTLADWFDQHLLVKK